MDLEGLTLWMYIKPTIKAVHNKLTTITASGLIGARLVHQPVLNIQVYVEDFPFSSNKWSRKKCDKEPAEIRRKH